MNSSIASPAEVFGREPVFQGGPIRIFPAEARRIVETCARRDEAQKARMVASKHRDGHLAKLVNLLDSGRWIAALSRVIVLRREGGTYALIDGEHTLTAIGMQEKPAGVVVSVLDGSDVEATEAYAAVGAVERKRSFLHRALAVGVTVPSVGRNHGGGGGGTAPASVLAEFRNHSRWGELERLSGLDGWRVLASDYCPLLERLDRDLWGADRLNRMSLTTRILSGVGSLSVLLEIVRVGGDQWPQFASRLVAASTNGVDTVSRALVKWIDAESQKAKPTFAESDHRLLHCWNAHIEGRYRQFRLSHHGRPIAKSKAVLHTRKSLAELNRKRAEVV